MKNDLFVKFLVGVSSAELNKHCVELAWEDSYAIY